MPDSYVTSAEIEDKEIVLYVKVDAFAPGEYVEISGCATQATDDTQGNGGFATFSEIKEVEVDKPPLEIRAEFTREFQDDLDVTVFVRVAKVWITVLSQGFASTKKAGSRRPWNSLKGVGGPGDNSSAQGSDSQAGVGAPPS